MASAEVRISLSGRYGPSGRVASEGTTCGFDIISGAAAGAPPRRTTDAAWGGAEVVRERVKRGVRRGVKRRVWG